MEVLVVLMPLAEVFFGTEKVAFLSPFILSDIDMRSAGISSPPNSHHPLFFF